jgi:hypothetical protein
MMAVLLEQEKALQDIRGRLDKLEAGRLERLEAAVDREHDEDPGLAL